MNCFTCQNIWHFVQPLFLWIHIQHTAERLTLVFHSAATCVSCLLEKELLDIVIL